MIFSNKKVNSIIFLTVISFFFFILLFSCLFIIDFKKIFSKTIKSKIILGQSKNIQTDDDFREAYLYPEENAMLYKYMDKSSVFFEFGSGGSTHQAAKRNLKIYTVEAAQCWILQLQREFQQIKRMNPNFNPKITYLVADIQTSIQPSRDDILKYVRIYNHSQYKADLILIDGKFRLACLMNVYQQIDENTVIFLHEPDKRSFKDIFTNYFDIIEEVNKSYILKRKKGSSNLSSEVVSKHETDDIQYSDQLVQMTKYIHKNFYGLYEKYKNKSDSEAIKPKEKQVWIFWWQSIEKAPQIVQICYKSILKNFKGGKVILITEQNYKDYTDIPQTVIDKLKRGRFSLTHFSDILRVSLLSKNGGLWLDSTIFLPSEIPSEFFEHSFYSIRAEDDFWIVFGKWCGFTQSSFINGIVTSFCRDFFYEYWEKFNDLADYFLIDFVILFGYEYIPAFRRSIQLIRFMHQKFLLLERTFSDVYSNETFNSILNSSNFFKLSYKKGFPTKVNESITNYGYFLEHYK